MKNILIILSFLFWVTSCRVTKITVIPTPVKYTAHKDSIPVVLISKDTTIKDSEVVIDAGKKVNHIEGNILYLKEDLGFNGGDYIIVSNDALRGTVGLGGQWPYKVFNTLSEAQSATLMQGEYFGCLSDGFVRRADFNDTVPAYPIYEGWGYYMEKIIPHNLDAQIIKVEQGGKKLTLGKSAKYSAAGVNIYKDSYYDYQAVLNNNPDTIHIPEGKLYFSWQPSSIQTNHDIYLIGAGADKTFLISPDGSPSMSLQLATYNNQVGVHVKGITVIGNNRLNGFRFVEDEIKQPLERTGYISNDFLWQMTKGIHTVGRHSSVEDCNIIDGFGYGVEVDGVGVKIKNCNGSLSDGEMRYMGWYFHVQGANDEMDTVENCTFTSPIISHAWEAFRTVNVLFLNCKSTNGLMAFNGASNCTVENMDFKFTANSYPVWSAGPIIDINAFMGANDGLTLKNMNIVQDDTVNTMNGIYAREGAKNVHIIGGSFTRHNGTDADYSMGAYLYEGEGALIDGFVCNGTQSKFYHDYPNANHANIGITKDGNGVVKNCKADLIVVPASVSQENNRK